MSPRAFTLRARLALCVLGAVGLAGGPAGAHASDGGAATADAGAWINPPDAPTLSVRADKNEARVGDWITVTVTAVGPRSVPVNLPEQLSLGAFTVLDRKAAEVDLGEGNMRRDFTLVVTAYEPGALQLPPVDVTYLGRGGAVLTARTQPLDIVLKSLLANEPEPQLKENAGPVSVWEENTWLVRGLWALAAALLGAGAGVILWRKLKARAPARPAPPPRPAHEVALERLDRLGAAGFLENADYRPFYFTLSEIVRDYLGARFGFDALELTSEELLAELRRAAPRELVLAEVEGWTAASDLVKFAKVSPSASEARGAFETALRIVAATRPRVAAVAPEGSAHG